MALSGDSINLKFNEFIVRPVLLEMENASHDITKAKKVYFVQLFIMIVLSTLSIVTCTCTCGSTSLACQCGNIDEQMNDTLFVQSLLESRVVLASRQFSIPLFFAIVVGLYGT